MSDKIILEMNNKGGKMNHYAMVKQTWFSGLKHRIGQKGRILKIIKSDLGRREDSFMLEFDDGEQRLFARYELEIENG